MSYMEALERLGKTTEREIRRLFGLYLGAEITANLFVDLGTVAVSLGQQQGRYMAELSLLAWLDAHKGSARPVAAPPIEHYHDSGRVRKGLETVIGDGIIDPDETARRLERLAFSETVESSQRAFGAAMAKAPEVKGWTRGLEPDACQLCNWWSRDGRIWPADHTMPTHKGCVCTPIPTAAEKIGQVGGEAFTMSNIRRKQGTYEERQQSGYADSKRQGRGR